MNDAVCIIPWILMYGRPDGAWELCCNQSGSDIIGNNDCPAAETWNSEAMCDIRRRMLSGQPVPQCRYCQIMEAAGAISDRMAVNKQWAQHFYRLDRTTQDGRLNLPPVYLDIRFSNACNYRCRMCSHGLSSRWYRESQIVGHSDVGSAPIVDAWSSNADFWEEFRDWILPSVEVIYFAGGEPLLMPSHYRMLGMLLENNRTDVYICYNTNLSVLAYSGESVLDMWKRFTRVHVWPSIDGVGARGEYIRKGLRWDNWVSNVRTCAEYVDSFSVALSVYNVAHYPELYLTLRQLFPRVLVDAQLVVFPRFLSIQCINSDPQLTTHVQDCYRNHEISRPDITADESRRIAGWLRFMSEGDGDLLSRSFRDFNETIDAHREESFVETFPELSAWYRSIGDPGASGPVDKAYQCP